ncbi:MAG: insulinase family protein [Phycisphaerales bacterium]
MTLLSRAASPLIALVTLAATALAQPLTQDPALVAGELDNGLRYIIRQHSIPPERASVWLHIHSGSLNETDAQRGLAHYLEHMAFNGSKNFEPGTLVPFFQSLGMTFGRDQNAFTNMNETTYQLTLPSSSGETLGKGMTFFADVVDGLLLLPAEIESERQIIQEERRRSLSGRQRTGNYVMERLAPGSVWGQRNTIGTEETINSVQQQDFRDYYGKWYAASNATLIVVADAPPAEVAKVVKDKFSAAPRRPRPTPQDPKVSPYEKSFAIVASDPEVRSESLRIVRITKARPAVTTVQLYRDELVGRLGEMALNRRFQDTTARGGTSYTSGRVNTGNQPGVMHTAELSGRASPGKWKPALNELVLELQRARIHGFTARELDEARKQLITGAERAVETEPTTTSGSLIAGINSNLASGDTILSPKQRLELLKSQLPTITPEEVSRRFSKEFEPAALCFIATLPSDADVPTEAQLLALGTKAYDAKPSQESEAAPAATELMARLPTPGTIAEQSEHAASKVWSGWLSNNIRVHHRFMDERKNQATIHIALAGGELLETGADRGITQAAQLGFSATKHLSSTEIRDLMSGRKVSVRGGGGFGGGGRGGGGGGGGGGGDTIALTISGSPDELEAGFQLAHLYLTEPRIEEAAFEQHLINARETIENAARSPQALGARTVAEAVYPDEPRHRPLTLEHVNRLTREAAQARLEKLIRESPIEVAIVGDIDRDKALALVNRYLGSLPKRERISPTAFADLRKVARPTGPRTIEKTLDTPTPQAFVYCGFYGADEANLADARALRLAARILSTRMFKEVREQEQLVYSISASSSPAAIYPGFGTFSAGGPTDPTKASALVAKLHSMYERFANEGPTDEELEVAKRQFAKDFVDTMKEPRIWETQLRLLTLRAPTLDDFLASPAAFEALTTKQIKDTFAKYYSKDSSITVVVKPAAAAPAKPEPADGGH